MRFSSAFLIVTALALSVNYAILAAKIDATKVHSTIVMATANSTSVPHKAFKASVKDQLQSVQTSNEITDSDSHEQTAIETTTKSGTTTTTAILPSIYSTVRGFWNWLRYDFGESLLGDDSTTLTGRTFGKIRRLQMALIPIMFKFGVLSAMIAFLVLLSMKILFLLKVLVFMNAAAILSKFLTLKTNFGSAEHSSAPVHWGYSNWNPSGWATSSSAASPPNKEIHLHIHGGQLQQPGSSSYSTYGAPSSQSQSHWERRSDPYAAYDHLAINDVNAENELTPISPINVLPTKYPFNHKTY